MSRCLYYMGFFCIIKVTLCFLHGDLIAHFSESKNVTLGTIFTCDNTKEEITVSKRLRAVGLRYLIADVNNISTAIIETVLRRKYYHLGVVLDGDCKNSRLVLNEFTDKKYFFETFHWLITSKSKETIVNVLSNVRLNINSDIHLVVSNENENFTVFDVYNPASEHGGKLTVNVLGYYNKNEGYRASIKGNRYWARKNMSGVTFSSAVVIPYMDKSLKEYLEDDTNRQVNSMNRFQSVCVNYCKELFNFSLRVQRTNSWGYIQADGHFDGLVGLLETRAVDFGSSPLIYKLDRMPVVDYGYGNWILRSTFIYRRPKAIAKSYEIFLRPFGRWLWIGISVAMVVILVALKTVFSNELSVAPRSHDGVDSTWSFLLLFALGAFCQQGAPCYPKMFSSRILSISIYLFCILIYQFYSSSIVSYVLMDPPRTINNLRDLVGSDLRVGIEDILIDRNYFVQTTDPIAIKLYETKIKGGTNDSGFYPPGDGLELVREGGFAFHVETSTAYPIIEETFSNELICELQEIQMYRTQPMHTNLQKNSPFREMMNYCMLKMVESGNMDRLRKHWDARKPACIQAAKKINIHVSVEEFSCGLIALSYGICFSLFFLLIETIIHQRNIIICIFRTKHAPSPSPGLSIMYPYAD